MTDNNSKTAPAGSPPDAEAMSRAVEAMARDPEEYGDTDVRLRVSGGVHGEAFDLDLAASSRGAMNCRLQCQLSDRSVDRQGLTVEPKVVHDIIRLLQPAALLGDTPRQGGFPPDSLIGRLEVMVGGQSMVTYFMADPEQAKTAGAEPPEQVLRAVERLYGEAERRLGLESVRP